MVKMTLEENVMTPKVLILGDIHTHWEVADETIAKALVEHPDITHIIQCGDMGDGFYDRRWEPKTNLPIHWCDGNHEDFTKIDARDFNPRLIYQPRGSVLQIGDINYMFMGGAHSIDKNCRIIFKSWWPQEDITQQQLDEALSYSGNIDVIISHERPFNFDMPPFLNGYVKGDTWNRRCLEVLHDKFRPRFWFHGHHHWGWVNKQHGTSMIACPIIESRQYAIFDGKGIIANEYRWKH